jgi:hypothetical protein
MRLTSSTVARPIDAALGAARAAFARAAILALLAAGCAGSSTPAARPDEPVVASASSSVDQGAASVGQVIAPIAVGVAAPQPRTPSSLGPMIERPTIECSQSGLEFRRVSLASRTRGVGRFSMASRGDSLAIAWLANDGGPLEGAPGFYVASLSTTLAVERQNIIGVRGASAIAIAENPTGYVAAVQVADGASSTLVVLPLTPGLAPCRPPVRIPGAWSPLLASRPGGAPLLVYVESSGEVVASLLDPEGNPLFRSSLYSGAVEPSFGSAVFTGDAFLVAHRINEGVTVARVELDGRVGERRAPYGSSTEYPWLSWDGHLATLIYTEFGNVTGVRLARLGPDGAPVERSIVLGAAPEHYNPSSSVATPEGAVIALAGHTGITDQSDAIDVATVDGQGALVRPACRLFGATPAGIASGARASRFGTGVAVAWIDGEPLRPDAGLTVVRLAPAAR